MKLLQKIKVFVCCLLIASLLPLAAWEPVFAENGRNTDAGVVVTNNDGFLKALREKKSPVIIQGIVTVANGAEASGRMRPIMIPAGTVIRGGNAESILCTRAPLQIEGDGVTIEDLTIQFESSNALGSVVHREIYLAGHSLTLDHVATYLEGNGGSFGDLGGTEKELLPTVYAGGYPGTSVSENASLTVRNTARDSLKESSIFQGIYMGHEAGIHGDVPYKGTASLTLTPDVIVRDGIYTNLNASAEVQVLGNGTWRDMNLYGNGSTTLLVRQSTLENARAESVGSLVLDDNAWMISKTCVFYNVTLKNNACLDFNQVPEAFLMGDFCGADSQSGENPGTLVSDSSGFVNIDGDVGGQTVLKAGNKNLASTFLNGRSYIYAGRNDSESADFLLNEADTQNGWALAYTDGAWTVSNSSSGEQVEIGSIEITSSPSAVDISAIIDTDGSIPNEDAFCTIVWRDLNGEIIPDAYVQSEDAFFYDWGYVVGIKTDYWESNDPAVLTKEDWGNAIWFYPSEDFSGKYYFGAGEGASEGDYTFLFLSQSYEGDPVTVADVKALKDTVKAELRVTLFDSSQAGVTPPEAHTHIYEGTVTEEATCSKAGKKTFVCTYEGCGESYTAETAKTEHTKEEDPAVAPTCTKEGKTAGSHCSVCGAVIKAQRTVPKTAHTEVSDPAVAPTCGADGKTQGSHCEVCDMVIVEQEVIEKTGKHTEVTDPAVEATCTAEGKTAGSHCSVCNTVITEQQATPKLSHEDEAEVIKEATCSETGEKKLTCKVCGDIRTEEIPMAAHTPVEDPAIEATCATEGKTAGSHCGVCNAVITEQQTIPALLHDYEEEVIKEATCSVTGEKKLTCKVCGEIHTEEIPIAAHTPVEDPAVAATCIREGKTAGSHCGVCEIIIEEQKILSKAAHDYKTQITKATLQTDGYSKTTCEKCGQTSEEHIFYRPASVNLSSEKYVYNGKEQKPSVTVTDSRGQMVDSKYYTVSYQNNKNTGMATAEISFLDKYEGVLTKKFSIVPKQAVIAKISAKSRGFLVKWKKQGSQAAGYVISYSTNKKFSKKTTKNITIKKKNTTSKTIQKLKAKKKYYVRIRAYQLVKQDGKTIRLDSAWSKVKTVKAKS